MARQEINIGAAPTGAGGDTTRSAAVKINAMTTELYARDAQLGTAANANIGTAPGNITQVVTSAIRVDSTPTTVGFSTYSGAQSDAPVPGAGGSRITQNAGGVLYSELTISANSLTSPTAAYRQFNSNGVPGPWNIIYTNQNTTRAADGTLKAI